MADITQKDYEPSDDDLPSSFWPGVEPPPPSIGDAWLERAAKVAVHYPACTEKKQKREETSASRLREEQDQGRKIYVKAGKHAQMWAWLVALKQQGTFPQMNEYERQFSTNKLNQFESWGMRIKWITQRQYEMTRSLAIKYLEIPD
jgi:hypothetical protein